MDLKFILEAVLFSAQKPLSPAELREVLGSAAEHADAARAFKKAMLDGGATGWSASPAPGSSSASRNTLPGSRRWSVKKYVRRGCRSPRWKPSPSSRIVSR